VRAPEAADALLVALGDADAWVRSQAARALTASYADSAGLDRSAVARRVADLVDDRDVQVRINALRTLATYEDAAFASAAAEAASDRDRNARVQALGTLGQLGGATAASILAERVTRGTFAERRQALLGMARAARDEALIQAAAWITNDEWTFRAAGAEALAIIGGDTALAWSEGLTRDEDARVVARGFSALGSVDSLRARAVARDLIGHADPVVRTVAATTMRDDPRRTDVDLLVSAYRQALQDQISDARVAVVHALAAVAELGYSERMAVEDQFLSRFPTSDDYLVRRAAAARFPAAAALWGDESPITTRRTLEDYRDVTRRLVMPAERDGVLPRLVIETERGTIRLTLYAGDAPISVDALLRLADRNYFDGSAWHRVVPNFVIQDGDPRGDGWGGPGFALRDEINRHRYETGTVGMALSGPDTGGSQFFITHNPQPHLDGTYTVIGRVDEGMDVVNRVTQGERIRRIRRP
jgi:cyclophilin family peptidyl-prolyl cis-trans isomerase/HEAT repeat protein